MADQDPGWLRSGQTDPAEVAKVYDDWAATYDADLRNWRYQAPTLAVAGLTEANPEASPVLDVGCGAGAFAGRLKQERGAEVWGIELDPEAARIADAALDRVLVGDALDQLERLPDGAFDCIVLNDILEHLVVPEALLQGLMKLQEKIDGERPIEKEIAYYKGEQGE